MWRMLPLGVLVSAVAGCAVGGVPSSATALPTPSTPGTTSTPLPSASTVPSAQPTPVSAVKVCERPDAGYAVSYPADWYVGAEADGFNHCSEFGPSPFARDDNRSTAISLMAEPDMGWNNPFEGSFGEFQGYALLLDEETRLFGRRVRHVEWKITEDGGGARVGDLQTRYAMEYRSGWFMTAQAMSGPEVHTDITATLMAMLESLRRIPIQ